MLNVYILKVYHIKYKKKYGDHKPDKKDIL